MAVCKCSEGYSNTGFDCTVNGSVIIGSIFLNSIKSDGSPNGLDFSADAVNGVIPASVIEAKLNDENEADRWYPVGNFENVEDVRAENIVETFNSGNSAFIKDGIRTFLGLLVKRSPRYKQTLDAFRCQSGLSKFDVDADGNLIGQSADDNLLLPIPVDNNTISARYVRTTDTEVSKIAFGYAYSQAFDDGNISMITADGTETDMKSIRGLLDATMTGTGTTLSTSLKITIGYGSAINDPLVLKSMTASDFSIQNVTQSAPVTIDAVDLSNADSGEYVLEYSSGVSGGDELRISGTKSGYDIPDLVITVGP